MMLKLIIYLMLLVTISTSLDEKVLKFKRSKLVSNNQDNMMRSFNWLGHRLIDNNIYHLFIPYEQTTTIEGRKRKKLKLNKYVFPLIIGFLLIKSAILPLALKALAILSGKAVVLSLMSLILAAIVGLRTVAAGSGSHAQNKVDLLSTYKRKDMLEYADPTEDYPYRYYTDPIKRKNNF